MGTAPADRTVWIVISLIALGSALFACFVGFVWSNLGGGDETALMLIWPLVGLIPAFGLLIRSIDGTGRPARWLVATLVLYGAWYLVLTGAILT
jgi:hypothetical protein